MPGPTQRVLVLMAVLALGMNGIAARALEALDFTVSGTDDGLKEDLEGASVLLASKKAKNVNALDLFADARAEYGRLIGTLYAHGYYGPVIHVLVDGREASSIAPLDAPAAIGRIAVTVDPGPVFAFSRTEIAPLAPKTVLPEGFAVGKVAESEVAKSAVQAGIDGWRARGYAKARVDGETLVADHATERLSVQVRIAPGPSLRFGALTINGIERMRAERVREIAGLPTGKRFDPQEEDRVAERLRRTGVWSSISLTEDDAITPPDLLGITADLVEAKRRRYTFGAEISSSDGLLLTGSWLHRNLFGGAERLEIKGEVGNLLAQNSGIDYSLGVTLDRPATLHPDATLNLGATAQHLNEDDYNADIFSASGGFTYYFSSQLTARAALGYDFTEGNDAAGDFLYRDLTLPLQVTWDRRDSKTDATRNFYIDLQAKPFYGFGSTDNGIRLAFDARAYKSAGVGRGVVFAARLQGGAVLGADILDTPRDDLFYAGGGGTVRGQPYQSLGIGVVRDGTPLTVGGNRFAAASLEARVRVSERIGVVAFADAGLVGLDGFSDEDSDWQAGAGLGLRYATGIGPVRLDVAAPVHGGSAGDVQIYVGLGQAF